jgi:hypothetical protein
VHRRGAWELPVVVAVVALLALAASACRRPSHDASTLSSSGADRARAEGLVLRLADLPAGWTASQYRPDPSQGRLDVELADCLGLPSFRAFQTAQVHSDDFGPGGGGFPRVTNEVTTFTSDRYPRQDLAAFEGEEFASCAAAQYRKLITDAGQPVGDISVAPLSDGQLGDPARVAGFRAHIALGGGPTGTSNGSGGESLVVDVFALVGPRLGATITMTNVAQPAPTQLERQLIAVEQTRVRG